MHTGFVRALLAAFRQHLQLLLTLLRVHAASHPLRAQTKPASSCQLACGLHLWDPGCSSWLLQQGKTQQEGRAGAAPEGISHSSPSSPSEPSSSSSSAPRNLAATPLTKSNCCPTASSTASACGGARRRDGGSQVNDQTCQWQPMLNKSERRTDCFRQQAQRASPSTVACPFLAASRAAAGPWQRGLRRSDPPAAPRSAPRQAAAGSCSARRPRCPRHGTSQSPCPSLARSCLRQQRPAQQQGHKQPSAHAEPRGEARHHTAVAHCGTHACPCSHHCCSRSEQRPPPSHAAAQGLGLGRRAAQMPARLTLRVALGLCHLREDGLPDQALNARSCRRFAAPCH